MVWVLKNPKGSGGVSRSILLASELNFRDCEEFVAYFGKSMAYFFKSMGQLLGKYGMIGFNRVDRIESAAG